MANLRMFVGTNEISQCIQGETVRLRVEPTDAGEYDYTWILPGDQLADRDLPGDVQLADRPAPLPQETYWYTGDLDPGRYPLTVRIQGKTKKGTEVDDLLTERFAVTPPPRYQFFTLGGPGASARFVPFGGPEDDGPDDERGDGARGDRPDTSVSLRRSATTPTPDVALWVMIRKGTRALSFEAYSRAMDALLCGIEPPRVDDLGRLPTTEQLRQLARRRILPFNDTDAYRFLKVATEVYVIANIGTVLEDGFQFTPADIEDAARRLNANRAVVNLDTLRDRYLRPIPGADGTIRTLPYLALVRAKLREAGIKRSLFANDRFGNDASELPEECYGILETKLTAPLLLELIWSYWHEEGMLVQTLGAISRRFQNMRGPGERDPLAEFATDPLRPLNNLLWGYIQDEQHRLSVVRRVYEYDHHYGLTLYGKAVPPIRGADSRSRFVEGLHTLLHLCTQFFAQDDDTTVIADGFPVLNGLKEVHLLLSQGAHNQFGDLPSTARQEMLIQQWLLARPEVREFLPTRLMVAYPEPWMDRVDAMKSLQGWTDTSVLHFHNLGVYGEQLLLSIRYSAWSTSNDAMQAANWARYWRAEIQGYIHAYRSVTGVDLTVDLADTRRAAERFLPPSVHLRRQLQQQRRGLPAGPAPGAPALSAGGMAPATNGASPAARRLPARR